MKESAFKTAQMKNRFARILKFPVTAVVYDLDGNVTKSDRHLTPEMMATILEQRRLGIPLFFASARTYDPQNEAGSLKKMGMKDALLDFNKYLDSKNIPPEERYKILDQLYLAGESGLFLSNGYLREDEHFSSYDDWLFQKLKMKGETSSMKQREETLRSFLNLIQHTLIHGRAAKERTFTIYGDKDKLSAIRNIILSELKEAGLWDENEMRISIADMSVEVSFYNVTKGITVDFLKEVAGVKDDEEGIILTTGDNGHPFSVDHPMLSRRGGLSSDRYDPLDPHMVALSLISGQAPGADSLFWAMKQFNYRSSTGDVIRLTFPSDNAMLGEFDEEDMSSAAPGGIDFSAKNVDLKEQGQTMNLNLSSLDFEDLPPDLIKEVDPLLFKISPLTNFSERLGL